MQNQTIRMNKRQFRIGELAKKLKVKKFVIRFWEKEFELKSDRSDGGQRFYNQMDLKKFSLIKDLLYNKKFTIPGAKKQLSNIFSSKSTDQINPATKFVEEKTNKTEIAKSQQKIFDKMQNLKEKLIKLKNNLH